VKTRADGKLADGGVALGTGLEATTELAGLIPGVDQLYHGYRAVKVDAMGAQAGELAKAESGAQEAEDVVPPEQRDAG
jgi:hypothetical protein